MKINNILILINNNFVNNKKISKKIKIIKNYNYFIYL